MKYKCRNVEKLHSLTSNEWKVFVFLVRHSDEYDATVRGAYYRDVMEETQISRAGYYLALKGLEEKQIIKVTGRDSGLDCDVCIIDNEYPVQDYRSEPYINFNLPVFHTDAFQKMKAHEKFLMVTFLRCAYDKGYSLQRNVKKFYEKYVELFRVTKRVIRSYMHTLKQFFIIGIKDGMYYITHRKEPVFHTDEDKKDYQRIVHSNTKSEETYHFEQIVRSECNRCHIAYTKESLKDTSELVKTFRGRFIEQGTQASTHIVLQQLAKSIRMSVEGVKRKSRKLSSAYINTILDRKLQQL